MLGSATKSALQFEGGKEPARWLLFLRRQMACKFQTLRSPTFYSLLNLSGAAAANVPFKLSRR